MKISQNKINDKDTQTPLQTGPKLRNIHDEKEVPEEKPAGADSRLKLAAAAVMATILFVGIKGSISNSALASDLEEQNKLLTAAQAAASEYGITEDENGELVLPVIDTNIYIDEPDTDMELIEQRNTARIAAFVKKLFGWEGQSGYNSVRQALMTEYSFSEDSPLLSEFMPETSELPVGKMSLVNHTPFALSDDGANISYFVICTVSETIDNTPANATVGVWLTINEDNSISDVVVQILQ